MIRFVLGVSFNNVSIHVNPTKNMDRIPPFLEAYRQIQKVDIHNQLSDDLIEYQCQVYVR
jgi:hypothetical protein